MSATFTREQFKNDRSAIMWALREHGRVVITKDGVPYMTLSRQTEALGADASGLERERIDALQKQLEAEGLARKMMGQVVKTRIAALEKALARLADAAETFASSEPDMPSHVSTESEFDEALAVSRTLLAPDAALIREHGAPTTGDGGGR